MLIADLQGADFDVSLTGFEATEIDDLFAATGKKEGKDDKFDLNAALEKASFVERGDMWYVGRHKLYCADATDADDVATLMDGKRANLVLTDPPYGVSFKSYTGLTIKNDSMPRPSPVLSTTSVPTLTLLTRSTSFRRAWALPVPPLRKRNTPSKAP